MADFIPCSGPRPLPASDWLRAAKVAVAENPANRPPVERLHRVMDFVLTPAHIALLVTKYWGAGGVKLGVAFLDTQDAELKRRILSHMNAWNEAANVSFSEAARGSAEVRVALTPGQGYWSYLGTDVRLIPAGEPTMNLDSFSMSTPEGEYKRVVRHETGHTLGFPHEHLRRDLVSRLDPQKTLAYFGRTQGWSEAEVRAQVLTPLDDATLRATPVDVLSIMCYQLPASITTDGRPIPGGEDIDASDYQFAASLYPGATAPAPPPAPPPAPGRAFGLRFASRVAKGKWFGPTRAPVDIEPGDYDVVRKS